MGDLVALAIDWFFLNPMPPAVALLGALWFFVYQRRSKKEIVIIVEALNEQTDDIREAGEAAERANIITHQEIRDSVASLRITLAGVRAISDRIHLRVMDSDNKK